MTYFKEISDYKTYSNYEDNLHFSYNGNSGGGQSFFEGQFYDANNHLIKAYELNGCFAKFQVLFTDEKNAKRYVILNDNNSSYEIKPRAENYSNMKFLVDKKPSPSKVIATFFMLPDTCGVKRADNPNASALSKNNFWLQSMWLNANTSQQNSVLLTLRDCVFCSLDKDNSEKLRCFSFDINKRILDIIRIADNCASQNDIIANSLRYFANIYKGIEIYNYDKCNLVIESLMADLAKRFPESYSGMIDPLFFVSWLVEKSTTNTNRQLNNRIENLNHLLPYITAIRTKPFLLLAGISGTGKSRLARQLAQATATGNLVNEQKPGNYELIPVKPNWHDSTELLGYVSRISGKPEYVMTDFVRFLFKAMLYPKTPFFLCLDEMNLAPVEQYFAEYLSVIETRSKLPDGTIVTDVLIKFDNEISKSFTEQLELYYNQLNPNGAFTIIKDKITNDGGLRIPSNLVVIGTVNMDETTFSFSRKVLDRAMSFELNVVNMNDGVEQDNAILPPIPSEAVTPMLLTANDAYTACPPVANYVLERLTEINDKMEGKPFKIAYRSRNEIMIYVYERLRDKIKENFPDDNSIKTSSDFHQAMDEAVSMKILSRIEGDEQRISKSFLDDLEKAITGNVQIIPSTTDSDVPPEDGNTLEESQGDIEEKQNTFKLYPICTKKLNQMRNQLANGYVSFWS